MSDIAPAAPSVTDNPLLARKGLPRFEAIEASHVLPAIRSLIEDQRDQLDRLLSQSAPSFFSFIEPLEESRHALERVWGQVSHLNAVLGGEALRAAYNEAHALVCAWQADQLQTPKLYYACQYVERNDPYMSPLERRVVEHRLQDMKFGGVDLSSEDKARFKDLILRLNTLTAKFEENIQDSTDAWSYHVEDVGELAGLPPSVLAGAQQLARNRGEHGFTLSLEDPVYNCVMANASSSTLRRTFYEAMTTRASASTPEFAQWDNSPLIEEMLKIRHELAHLLGFANFAELSLSSRMAGSSKVVASFLEDLRVPARTAATQELGIITAFAGQELNPWDVVFWSERLKSDRIAVSQEEISPYLNLQRALSALVAVAYKLFGVTVVDCPDVEVWHPDVRYFEVFEGETLKGGFYLDPYARPEKQAGAWVEPCIGRINVNAHVETPVVFLTCNFMKNAGDAPAQLTHEDVITLFHEFGHALHVILTRIDYPTLAGFNGVPWDAVELPSQFLENYAWNEDVLRLMAFHITTGAPLPEKMLKALVASRTFNAGLTMLKHVELALFDFYLYAEYDAELGGQVLEILKYVQERASVLPAPAWTRMPNSFSHIFSGGYESGYYSYHWAEVMAADAYSAFESSAFDPHVAKRFLDTILTQGGAVDAMEAFVAFRGRAPSLSPFLKQYGIE